MKKGGGDLFNIVPLASTHSGIGVVHKDRTQTGGHGLSNEGKGLCTCDQIQRSGLVID